MADSPADQILFTYGTLQQPEVQLDTFGRLVAGEDDSLPGYTVDYVEIDDQRVVDLSGLGVHPIVRPTGSPRDRVVGRALHITEDELEAADEYEVALYRRAAVTLASGRPAWVYVSV
ncbi:MAG: gamma-glutamylcyclotransferase [Microbacterium sp.]|uniref:gamma-glutamylcyclotransferase family protein n=2 Tax=Microbacterium sp. TaxID=51671 RepID=UPI0009264706|nr:gamma-glutamylcyclotransferase family protein [Microbacterium sp.]OJU61308.1 MAG: UDP-N-acetylmuramate--alanine ligase [Microbacterium sp. 70-38]MBN9186485.1 gamma-glutamylcyclotransferase [Microbacterium sp.]MBN9189797.1 gamma-glutamylcyclotransferase [Microbacterium sp.]MBN9191945.1 gamma-glutamylcyclotransferase [Microbacterium sp.]MBN9195844.1 gamma-glutamylcyclotransferase [Microbacterium sp.]